MAEQPEAADRSRGGPAGARERPRGRRRVLDAVVGVATVTLAAAAVVVLAALLSIAVAAIVGSP